jgi:hypothetical protein
MSDTWITDITHYLDADGNLPPDLPGPARNLANYLGSLIAAVSAAPCPIPRRLNVQCRRRPGRRPCPGFIEAMIDPDDYSVVWHCPSCGDNGFISNWEGTAWDKSVLRFPPGTAPA